ncbi:hypothetical protein ACFLQI_02275 [Candidatus Undinarchaeota archaeon]
MGLFDRKKKKKDDHIDSSGTYPRFKNSGRPCHNAVAKTPPGQHTHHIDGNKQNFSKSNLRNMTPSAHAKLEAKKRRATAARKSTTKRKPAYAKKKSTYPKRKSTYPKKTTKRKSTTRRRSRYY